MDAINEWNYFVMKLTDANIGEMFPEYYGSFDFEFSIADMEMLHSKWLNIDYQKKHCGAAGGYKIDAEGQLAIQHHSTIDPDASYWTDPDIFFKTLWMGVNIIHTHPDFVNIKHMVTDSVLHYMKNMLGYDIPDSCYFEICDSWFTNTIGHHNASTMSRPHTHAFSFISAVLYLDDSDHNLYFLRDMSAPRDTRMAESTINYNNQTFAFRASKLNKYTSGSLKLSTPKGRLYVFPSDRWHALGNSRNAGENKNSIAMNLMPKGEIGLEKTGLLRL